MYAGGEVVAILVSGSLFFGDMLIQDLHLMTASDDICTRRDSRQSSLARAMQPFDAIRHTSRACSANHIAHLAVFA